ncbi:MULTISPECIES: hypothetical protein [Gordonia]|jgi:hypothetical protein|uniref:Uncharacterized protein n=1 Tax=Gordonia amicalis TaxID=89053 RepID=A0AAE4R6Q4_9ACTN|nr:MULTISPECIES: hypothetical protein [Gordonia]ATD69705.1 hypothetical protein CNO18_04800 [Gordonia sp. 1D]KAF0968632.1 hypothetical protein BPODLACK_02997 [Gordonia sp. YY1]MBA5845668.1 hypothetical protein [Gordonia amicalis]MCR8896820.1 hypothetical protein [Gordonia sp. GONU]MCZ0911745.1 hypothetical protein [Gordonia amicalis]
MTYLFAVLGLLAIGFLMWRAFGPQSDGGTASPSGGHRRRTRGPVGPDDDPDFLRDLDNRTRGTNGGEADEL